MKIRHVTSCMPSERSGKNLWPENERLQDFTIFEKFRDLRKKVEKGLVFKQYWFRRHTSAECKRVTESACIYKWIVLSLAGLLLHVALAIRRASDISAWCDDSTSHPRGDHGWRSTARCKSMRLRQTEAVIGIFGSWKYQVWENFVARERGGSRF